jgi:hypothetical protein
MYRVIAVVGCGLAVAACSSTSDWMGAFKPAPLLDTVRFESTPPGADVKTSNGQTCRTPCALALPTESPLTATFTLNGYLPDTETLDPIANTGSAAALQPNPVLVELEPSPPPAKPVRPTKKPAPKKKVSAVKPAAPKPAAAAPMAAPPAAAAPAQSQAASPWPAPPAPQR